MEITTLLAIAFATYLLTTYLVYENGPFNICAMIRFFAGINVPISDMNGEATGDFISNGTVFAEMLSCHRCTGMWIGLLMVVTSFFVPLMVMFFGAIGFGVFLMDLTHGEFTE